MFYTLWSLLSTFWWYNALWISHWYNYISKYQLVHNLKITPQLIDQCIQSRGVPWTPNTNLLLMRYIWTASEIQRTPLSTYQIRHFVFILLLRLRTWIVCSFLWNTLHVCTWYWSSVLFHAWKILFTPGFYDHSTSSYSKIIGHQGLQLFYWGTCRIICSHDR